MDKTTLAAIAALLLAAVLCTAGCIEAPSDPIVGNWISETDDSVTYAVFENDGAGYFAADKDSVLTLEWKANGDTTYTFIFADGTTKTASINAEHGLMTMSDGCVLEKQPNRLSGKVFASTESTFKGNEAGRESLGGSVAIPGGGASHLE